MHETETTAVEIALERLAPLMRSGAAPARVIEAIGQLVTEWAAEADMDTAKAQARIGEMWDSISRDAGQLQEQIADTDGPDIQARNAANRVLIAMQAAVSALAAAHQRL